MKSQILNKIELHPTFRNEGLFFVSKKPKMRKFLAQDLAQFLAQEGLGNKKRFQ